jgi:hypothetical protein
MSTHALLPPYTLAEIVDRFGTRPVSGGRDYLRFPLRHCNATARRERDGSRSEPFEIEIVDLGTRGIGFETQTPITEGMVLNVELRIPGMLPQAWRCNVVGVHAFDGRVYRAGARFQSIANA